MMGLFGKILVGLVMTAVIGVLLLGAWTYHSRQWQAWEDAAKIREMMEKQHGE